MTSITTILMPPVTAEPHSHPHVHEPLKRAHAHYADIHHRQEH
jgi:hypothetical protein